MYPKLIEIGDFFLPAYGVLVAIAFLAGIFITERLARRAGLKPTIVADLAILCAIAGIVGAKLFMFLFDWRYYTQNWREIFSISTLMAAGVYQGGFALAVLVAFLFIRKKRLPGLRTADVFSPGIALGHAIGRLGCFAAGCCWGQACSLPWAVTFTNPQAKELTGVPLGEPLHPTQIYESLMNFALFGFLLWYIRRPHRDGAVIGWYLVLSSIGRFLVEFVRHHDQALQFGLSLTQWISIATLVAGVWIFARSHRDLKVSQSAP